MVVLAAVSLNIFCAAQTPEWQPRHLEELSIAHHRIAKQLLEILRSAAKTSFDSGVCEIPPDVEQRSSLRFVKLASNGRTQVIVQGVGECQCSPTGNCSFWIYEKSANGYRPLLATDMVQVFSVENTRSHGYRDIVTGAHGSAFDTDLTVFKFDGEHYQPRECWRMSYPQTVDSKSYRIVGKSTLEKRDCYHSH